MRRIQFVYRNDTEADAPAEQVANFDRTVQGEDKRLLETMAADCHLDPRAEAHMAMDRPNLLYRERLVKLILTHDPNADLVRAELGQLREPLLGQPNAPIGPRHAAASPRGSR